MTMQISLPFAGRAEEFLPWEWRLKPPFPPQQQQLFKWAAKHLFDSTLVHQYGLPGSATRIAITRLNPKHCHARWQPLYCAVRDAWKPTWQVLWDTHCYSRFNSHSGPKLLDTEIGRRLMQSLLKEAQHQKSH